MQSMTGYGRARSCRDGREITIELKTVNHRFLDLSFRIPKNLAFLEDPLRSRINASGLRRGHVDVFVTYANTRTDAREVRLDGALLEACVRDDLGQRAPRAMAVLHPLKVELTNWPQGQVDDLTMENHPDKPELGQRTVHMTGTLYIDREDFMEDPPKKFFRLAPGREVRLKGAYIIRCDEVVKDEAGQVALLKCSVDLTSRSGQEGANRKVKGTLHWISDMDAVPAQVRLYEPILREEDEEAVQAEAEVQEDDEFAQEQAPVKADFIQRLNPNSLTVVEGALVEPVIAQCQVGDTFQFLRTGYFCKDPDSTAQMPVFNRVVPLKDSWAKVNK